MEQKTEQKPDQKPINAAELFLTALFPHMMGKILVLYFGINYANYPGEGYGVGLALSIALCVVLVARFLYKSRNYQD